MSHELRTPLNAIIGLMVACFMDDFEACIAHLRFPVTHRRAIRNRRLVEEARRHAARERR
jgi:signal transduction histidine kinase